MDAEARALEMGIAAAAPPSKSNRRLIATIILSPSQFSQAVKPLHFRAVFGNANIGEPCCPPEIRSFLGTP